MSMLDDTKIAPPCSRPDRSGPRPACPIPARLAHAGFLILALWSVSPANADQVLPALSLAQFLGLVEQGNPELAASRHQGRIAQAGLQVAGAYPNPVLEVDAGGWRPRAGSSSGSTLAYGITQPLDLPSVRASRIAAAAAGADSAVAFAQSVRLAIGTEARKSYFDLVRRKQDERLAGETLDLLEQIQGRVQTRVEVGEAPRFELVRAEAETLAARNALAAARLRVEEARATLRRLLGGAFEAPFDIREDLPYLPELPPLAELQSAVLSAHPALRAAEAERERAQRQLEQERALRTPQPSLRLGEARDPEVRSMTIGVALSIPIWDRRDGQIAQARASIDLATAQLDRQRAQLLRELEAAHARFAIAQRQIATFEAGLLRSAESASRVAEAAYRFGERSFIEVLDAQRTLRLVRSDYNQARFERILAWLDIDRLRAHDPFRPENP